MMTWRAIAPGGASRSSSNIADGLPLRELIAPAIMMAREGFLVDEHRQRSIDSHRYRLYLFPASRKAFLPDGQAPVEGSVWRQPDLGRTLQAISDHGEDGFYRGWVADRIVEEMERGGGIITHDDLAGYRAVWREPVVFDVFEPGGRYLGQVHAPSGFRTLPQPVIRGDMVWAVVAEPGGLPSVVRFRIDH